MKILVTGGAGFIGSHVVDLLINEGHQVVVADILSTGKRENLNDQAVFYQIDITSLEMETIFQQEKITHVIHQAAQIDVQKSLKDPMFDARNNILGTINLLELCRKYNVDKLIYPSSAAVYGTPLYLPVDEEHPAKAMSPYGISKHTPEHYLRMYKKLYDLDYTIFRYANVYGPRQDPRGEGGVISIFVDRLLDGKRPVIYGDGEQTRDFIHVTDIARANVRALSAGNNRTYNISSNTKNSINRLVEIINEILGTDYQPVYKGERQGDIRDSFLANSLAIKELEWKPDFDLYSGMVNTLAYYARWKGREEVAAAIEEGCV